MFYDVIYKLLDFFYYINISLLILLILFDYFHQALHQSIYYSIYIYTSSSKYIGDGLYNDNDIAHIILIIVICPPDK